MEEKKKSSKGLHAFLIMAAILAVFGVTYAFITIVLTGEKTNTITGGSLQLTLNDSDETLGNATGDTISIDNAFPVTDAVGQESAPYKFRLKSTGDKDASYTVFLDPDDYVTGDSRMLDSQIKASLMDDAGNELLAPTLVSALTIKGTESSETTETTPQSRVLYSGVLSATGEITFQLRLWIDQDADETVLGKQYATKISVDAVQVPEYAVTVVYPTTETIPPTEEGGSETTKTTQNTSSKAVFKGATATITVPAEATGTPSISCTGTQATVEKKTDETTSTLEITAANVTEHTACTITYTTE